MKHRGKSAGLVLAGVLVGLSIVPAASAVSEYLTATPSTQTFYVDDQQVELEAYAINGNNYVKLRDIGQAVGFNVAYDPDQNAAIMEPDKPYTGEDVPTVTPPPTPQPAESIDYAQQANPAIFSGAYTKELYNALRYAVTHPEEIASGTYQPISIGQVNTSAALEVASKLSVGSTYYSTYSAIDGSTKYLSATHQDSYDAAIVHVQPFLQEISGLPQREQVRQMVWYIADRMTYSTKIKALPSTILAQDNIMEEAGSCMTYSSSLWFLCEQAGIPCVLVDGDNHQWNMVYVDSHWWHVDPTADNQNILTSRSEEDLEYWRSYTAVLYDVIGEVPYIDGSVGIDPMYVDEHPQVTQFLKELMVPGSTK